MKNDIINPGARLVCAASYLGGGIIADIGTDHAYLPVYLIQNGYRGEIIASDVAEGPLQKARLTLKRYQCEDSVKLIRADGLAGIEAYAPGDIVIAGMGGELISSILSASEYVRRAEVKLILQPMSRASQLRRWLCENGFEIIDETLVRDGRIFELLYAHYDGLKRDYDGAELLLGRINIQKRPEPFAEFARRKRDAMLERAEGMKSAGLDANEYFELYGRIKELIE